MFSTTPSTLTPTRSNILAPRKLSPTAISCGVVTMIAPWSRTIWVRDIAQELADDLHDDRASPDRRRIPLHDEPQRHQLHAVRLERLDLAALDLGLVAQAEHARDVGPVDVRIHQPDAVAVLRERGSEIGGDRR